MSGAPSMPKGQVLFYINRQNKLRKSSSILPYKLRKIEFLANDVYVTIYQNCKIHGLWVMGPRAKSI